MATKTKAKSGERFDINKAVTDKIVAALEAGTVPWRKPWNDAGLHRNVASKRPYRGVNQLLLGLTEWEQPWWITFNKAKELGGTVKPEQARKNGGPGPELVTFWKTYECRTCKGEGGSCEKCGGRGRYFFLRYYNVWNVEQFDGLPDGLVPAPAEEVEHDPIEAAAELILPYFQPASSSGPKLSHGGSAALYTPGRDAVRMPKLASFHRADGYYAALFHEAVHSTGHAKRLARPELMSATFGSEPYAKEELVAEVGSAILCALAGVACTELDENTAAYIASWLTALRNDTKLIVSASARAQAAVDLIVGDDHNEGES